ncbi:MAG: MFS transporter [Hyphomicrobiaceae bacterium]|nr:MFS transporter [Hyphomicrobiaceae bacterium]
MSTTDQLGAPPSRGFREHGPALLVALGHGATHWNLALLYMLLPFIARELGLSYTETGILMTFYHGSSFAANVGSGAVVDISGRRVVVQAGALVVGGAALFAMGLAANVFWLAIPVMLIAMTNNIWHPAAISYLSRLYPNGRGFALSIHTLGASFGDILAPAVGALLLLALSWRGVTMVAALPVFAIAVILLVVLTEIRNDNPAGAPGGGKLGHYLHGLRGLVQNKAVLALCLLAGFRSMVQNGMLMFIPLYLVGALNAGPKLVGFAAIAIQIGGVVAGPVAGAWSDRIGRQPVVLVGLVATTLLVGSLAIVKGAVLFVTMVFLLGFALFAVRPVVQSWMIDMTPKHLDGSAISLLFGSQSGMTMLVPIVGGIIADTWGIGSVFYFLTATVLCATLIAAVMPSGKVERG